jgi:Arc/MetJ family transcription regulator
MNKSLQILRLRSREFLRSAVQVSVFSVAVLGLTGVSAAQTATSSSPQSAQPADPAQVEKIKSQLIEVDTKIRAAQQKALQAETVKEKRETYDKSLRAAMVKEEPKVKSLLEKQDGLISELKKSDELNKPADQRSPEFQKRFQEYQKLSDELSPIAQKSSEKPEVAETYKELQTVLATEMKKAEPAVPQLVQQRGELISQYQQLVQSSGR